MGDARRSNATGCRRGAWQNPTALANRTSGGAVEELLQRREVKVSQAIRHYCSQAASGADPSATEAGYRVPHPLVPDSRPWLGAGSRPEAGEEAGELVFGA